MNLEYLYYFINADRNQCFIKLSCKAVYHFRISFTGQVLCIQETVSWMNLSEGKLFCALLLVMFGVKFTLSSQSRSNKLRAHSNTSDSCFSLILAVLTDWKVRKQNGFYHWKCFCLKNLSVIHANPVLEHFREVWAKAYKLLCISQYKQRYSPVWNNPSIRIDKKKYYVEVMGWEYLKSKWFI